MDALLKRNFWVVVVALGAIARAFLGELGIRLVSHTLSIGPVRVPDGSPEPADAPPRSAAASRGI